MTQDDVLFGDDIGRGHHLALGHRGAPYYRLRGEPTSLDATVLGTLKGSDPSGARYTTSSDVIGPLVAADRIYACGLQ